MLTREYLGITPKHKEIKMNQKLLIVDDDITLSLMIKEYLEAKNFRCYLFHNGFEALESFKKTEYALCILDVRMPMKNGFEFAQEILAYRPDVPFLFLSAQSDKDARIKGLELGADDYMVKPFSMQELYLRIKAILKRVEASQYPSKTVREYIIGDYTFYADIRELHHPLEKYKLSEIESKLLLIFCNAENGVILRDNTLKQIWPEENLYRERSLNVYVSKLRGFLKRDDKIDILNIHGTGYKMIIKQ